MTRVKKHPVRDDGDAERPTRVRKGKVRGARLKKRTIRLGRRGEGPPFGREFFAAVLPAMVEHCQCAKDEDPQVLLHLGDGSLLDVQKIVGLSDRFAVVAAFGEGPGEDGIPRTADDLVVEAFPYDLVLRATVQRMKRHEQRRFGFATVPPVTFPNAAEASGGASPSAATKEARSP